jgi:MFS family permease
MQDVERAAAHLARRAVAVSALGYFVDIFDLFLFSVLRVPSLEGIGVPPQRYLPTGAMLLNWQLAGLLIGSLVWGVLGDRRGRVRALYGSILLYSLATLTNAVVTSLPAYAACRFIAGLGLGGELGAAITLVSESLPTARRGLGTMLVAGFGLCGGVAAAGMAELLPWRVCYGLGGALGLVLLGLRIQLLESPLFGSARQAERGRLRFLLKSARRRGLYLRLVLVGLPIWFVAGILMVFSPEFGRALGVPGVTAARAVLTSYLGVALGDFLSGLLSQYLRSRKRAIALFLGLLAVSMALFLLAFGVSPTKFYAICFVLGLGTGYWAVLCTCAAEHFGTNLRATVATTVPNLIRASVIPLSLAFQFIARHLDFLAWGQRLAGGQRLIASGAVLGGVCVALALWALRGLDETYSRDLNFAERP